MPSQRSRQPAERPPLAPGQPAWVVGPQWTQLRLRQPGWLLLPLRGFLAVTFIYAGLQKLANSAYLDPSDPSSVVGQMQSLRSSSPIGPLLGLSLHAPTLVGLSIALGEFAVGIGALLGLWTRAAAIGGMLLSLSFFLSVSWTTHPYYYGSDIVFFFAWTVIAGFGAAGVLSLDAWSHARARVLDGLSAQPAMVTIEASRVRQLCGRGDSCRLQPTGTCTRGTGCPVFHARQRVRDGVDRRAVLLGARTAGLVAMAAAGTAVLAAARGRRAGGAAQPSTLGTGASTGTSTSTSPTSAAASAPTTQAAGTAIGPTSAVAVGQAARFTDPATGGTAWMVRPSADQFVAFSATCTHAGCTVSFEAASLTFICPCHGGRFDATTGKVLGGPPPRSLPRINVAVVDGQLRVD